MFFSQLCGESIKLVEKSGYTIRQLLVKNQTPGQLEQFVEMQTVFCARQAEKNRTVERKIFATKYLQIMSSCCRDKRAGGFGFGVFCSFLSPPGHFLQDRKILDSLSKCSPNCTPAPACHPPSSLLSASPAAAHPAECLPPPAVWWRPSQQTLLSTLRRKF